MKQVASYRVVHLSLSKLFRSARLRGDFGIELDTRSFRSLLLRQMGPDDRAMVRDDSPILDAMSRAASAIPYNAALRQLWLLTAPAGLDARERRRISLRGPEERDYYLKDILYIHLDRSGVSDTALRHLLRGLTLRLDDEAVTYTVFERSASQQREGELILIRQSLYALGSGLRSRIDCGMPPEISVKMSKYTAYRALMLTSGVCMDVDGLLDAHSVLVVDDPQLRDWAAFCKAHGLPAPQLAGDVATVSYRKDKTTAVTDVRYRVEKQRSAAKEKLFDGEGLVCTSLGRQMAAAVEVEGAQSFQIRMPFVKGVVHTVDLETIFRDLAGERYPALEIRDCFGVPHRVSEIRMILPTSMFKLHEKYKQVGAAHGMDGGTYYWQQFRAGEHCLVVSRCEEGFSAGRITASNYQFLSTLQEIDDSPSTTLHDRRMALAAPSVSAVWTAVQSQDAALLLRMLQSGDDLLDAAEAPALSAGRSDAAALLRACPALCRTAGLRDDKEDIARFCRTIAAGHLYYPGVMRYLSGDLFQLLLLLADRMYLADTPDAPLPTEWLVPWLAEASDLDGALCYAPGEPAAPAVMDRNPHLARNEHVLTETIAPGVLRERYLGHLRGIVMMQGGREVQRLAGADFDGDLVRLYYDPVYRLSAAPAAATLPLLIPSETEDEAPYTDAARMAFLRRAEGSRVGQISNAAFRTSLYAYGTRKMGTKRDGIAASREKAEAQMVELSCLVGLEIDSAKTGMRPVYDDSDLLISRKKKGDTTGLDFFLQCKDRLRNSGDKPKLAPLGAGCGRYSVPELLPYVFAPGRIEVDPKFVPDAWAKKCHDVLWETKRNGAFHRKDKLTAYHPDAVPLWQLLASPPSAAPLPSALRQAYLAARAVRTPWHTETEESRHVRGLRAHLGRSFGIDRGLQLCDRLLDTVFCFEDDTQPETLLFRLLPWHHYGSADLRRIRFNALAADYDIAYRVKEDDAFDRWCCRFDRVVTDSSLLAEILLTCPPSQAETAPFPPDGLTLPADVSMEEFLALHAALWDSRSIREMAMLAETLAHTPPKDRVPLLAAAELAEDATACRMAAQPDCAALCALLTVGTAPAAQVRRILRDCIGKQIGAPLRKSDAKKHAAAWDEVWALWQQLHMEDNIAAFADALLAPPVLDWIGCTDATERRLCLDGLLATLPQGDRLADALGAELLDMLAAPAEWRLLPDYLSAARATVKTVRERRARQQFLADADAAATQTASPRVRDFLDLTPDTPLAERIDRLRLAAQEIASHCVDDPDRMTDAAETAKRLAALETGHGAEEVEQGTRLFYALLRLSLAQLRQTDAIAALLAGAAGADSIAPAVLALLAAERDGIESVDDAASLEQLVLHAAPDTVCRMLARIPTLTRIADLPPDGACGFVDGQQGIELTRERGAVLAAPFRLKVETVVGGERPVDAAMLEAQVTFEGDPAALAALAPAVSLEMPEETARDGSLLWLYSVPFVITVKGAGETRVPLLHGALTHLRIPQTDGTDDPAYAALREPPLTLTLDIRPGRRGVPDLGVDSQNGKTMCQRPLGHLVWGYRMYARDREEAQDDRSNG